MHVSGVHVHHVRIFYFWCLNGAYCSPNRWAQYCSSNNLSKSHNDKLRTLPYPYWLPGESQLLKRQGKWHTQVPCDLLHPTRTVQSTPIIGPRAQLDTSPHDGQDTTIQCLRKLGDILHAFPNIAIRLVWLPKKAPSIGFRRAKQLAVEVIRTAKLTEIKDPHSIKNQKEKTKEAASAAWMERWHHTPHTSLVYQTALTKPPDRRAHLTFRTAPSARPPTATPEGDTLTTRSHAATKLTSAKFLRRTHAALYRVITDHAFTGAYTQRFYPHHAPEQIACL